MFKKALKTGLGSALLIGASLAVFTPTTAIAQTASGWYVNLSGGVNFNQNADVDVPVLPTVGFETSQSVGPVVLGAVGKKFSSGLRVEGEVSYRKNDFDDITVSIPATLVTAALTGTADLSGDISSLGFMANVAYDFNKGSKLRPYVIGGLGGASVSANDVSTAGILLVDDDDFVFAFQAGAGINYEVTSNVSIGLSYRFFGTSDPEFLGADSTTTLSTQNFNHSILAGLTFNF